MSNLLVAADIKEPGRFVFGTGGEGVATGMILEGQVLDLCWKGEDRRFNLHRHCSHLLDDPKRFDSEMSLERPTVYKFYQRYLKFELSN